MPFPRRPGPVHVANAFCVVRRSTIHGHGMFARRRLIPRLRLLEYLGERITKEKSTRRGLAQEDLGRKTGGPAVFIFDLTPEWDLDGNRPYNLARFVNHSCRPNCEFRNEADRLFLYTTRPVRKGEELTVDYGYAFEHFRDHPCRCGAPGCVGHIVRREDRPALRRQLLLERQRLAS